MRSTVGNWIEAVEQTQIPDFHDAVSEYHAFLTEQMTKAEVRSQQENPDVTLTFEVIRDKNIPAERYTGLWHWYGASHGYRSMKEETSQ